MTFETFDQSDEGDMTWKKYNDKDKYKDNDKDKDKVKEKSKTKTIKIHLENTFNQQS